MSGYWVTCAVKNEGNITAVEHAENQMFIEALAEPSHASKQWLWVEIGHIRLPLEEAIDRRREQVREPPAPDIEPGHG